MHRTLPWHISEANFQKGAKCSKALSLLPDLVTADGQDGAPMKYITVDQCFLDGVAPTSSALMKMC